MGQYTSFPLPESNSRLGIHLPFLNYIQNLILIYSNIFSGIGDPLYLDNAELQIPHGGIWKMRIC